MENKISEIDAEPGDVKFDQSPLMVPVWAVEETDNANPAASQRAPLSREKLVSGAFQFGFMFFPLILAGMAFKLLIQEGRFFLFVARVYPFLTLYIPFYFAIVGLGLAFTPKAFSRPRMRTGAMALCWAIFLVGYGMRLYATTIGPNFIQVRRVTLEIPELREPVRLLHITDIQTAAIGSRERKAFRMMAELKPDLLIHTGDLLQPLQVSDFKTQTPKLRELFESLDPPLGKFTVEGDVDDHLLEPLGKGEVGIVYLYDNEAIISLGETRLRIFGLSLDASRLPDKGKRLLNAWRESLQPGDISIVAGHAPDYILAELGKKPGDPPFDFDLCLAGHTHGGQVRLPFWGALIWLSGVPAELSRGFHEVGDTRINVSAGLGAERMYGMPIIRFNCPPEMTVIDLIPPRAGQ